MNTVEYDLLEFIKFNWFTLSLIFGILSFGYKTVRYIEEYKKSISEQDRLLNEKLEHNFEEIRAELNKLSNKLDEHIVEQDIFDDDRAERTKLIMNGVEATLKTLHAQGHNGPVTKSLDELNQYKLKKATER